MKVFWNLVRAIGPAGIAAATMLLTTAPAVQAQTQSRFPSRAITLVVPFGPGGGPDIYARKFAQKLEQVVGQPVIVDNRTGANSVIGTNYVAKSKPDGYTMLYATNSSLSAAPGMFKSLPYDPVKDFSGVSMIAENYFALLVRLEDKGMSLAQVVERMKRDPARYPVAGGSTTQEVINGQLQAAAKTTSTYVRYAQASQMMVDLMGGRLGLAVVPITQAMPFVTSGKAVAVAVTSPTRLRSLPDIPTVAETFPGLAQETWTGFFVAAHTPRDIVDTLHAATMKVFDDPEMLKLTEDGGRQMRTSPEETDAFVKKEVPRWSNLLKTAGIEPN